MGAALLPLTFEVDTPERGREGGREGGREEGLRNVPRNSGVRIIFSTSSTFPSTLQGRRAWLPSASVMRQRIFKG